MDPIITPALLTTALSKMVNAAATDLGANAWSALKTLIAKHRGTTPNQPDTPEAAAALAEQLASDAATNPGLARDLATWQKTVTGDGNVTNIVTGSVRNVVQARDVSSPITFN